MPGGEQQAAAFSTLGDFAADIDPDDCKHLDSGQHDTGSQAINDNMAVSEKPSREGTVGFHKRRDSGRSRQAFH